MLRLLPVLILCLFGAASIAEAATMTVNNPITGTPGGPVSINIVGGTGLSGNSVGVYSRTTGIRYVSAAINTKTGAIVTLIYPATIPHGSYEVRWYTGSTFVQRSAPINVSTTFPLTFSKNGTGTGTTPATGLKPKWSYAAISAAPSPTSTFTRWTCNGVQYTTPTASIYMNTAKTCIATFTVKQQQTTYALALATTSVGGGVTSPPNGNVYPAGTSVTITGTPNAGWQFMAWTCNGVQYATTPITTVTMNQFTSCVVTFAPIGYAFTVNAAGPGTVSSSLPPGTYAPQTYITISAVPNGGSTFESWTCNNTPYGTLANAAVTMNGPVSCTATFTAVTTSKQWEVNIKTPYYVAFGEARPFCGIEGWITAPAFPSLRPGTFDSFSAYLGMEGPQGSIDTIKLGFAMRGDQNQGQMRLLHNDRDYPDAQLPASVFPGSNVYFLIQCCFDPNFVFPFATGGPHNIWMMGWMLPGDFALRPISSISVAVQGLMRSGTAVEAMRMRGLENDPPAVGSTKFSGANVTGYLATHLNLPPQLNPSYCLGNKQPLPWWSGGLPIPAPQLSRPVDAPYDLHGAPNFMEIHKHQ